MVTRLDRLACSTCTCASIAAAFDRKQVNLQVLDQHLDTSNATGRLLFNMLGAIAQFETEIRAERQWMGFTKPKRGGAHFGRKKIDSSTDHELQRRRAQGMLIKTLMREYGLSKASVYRYLCQTDFFPSAVVTRPCFWLLPTASAKDFTGHVTAHAQREGVPMAIEQIHTYCAMCVSRCGVVATVEDGQPQRSILIPNTLTDASASRERRLLEINHAPDRLQYPMMRTRPKGEPDPGGCASRGTRP